MSLKPSCLYYFLYFRRPPTFLISRVHNVDNSADRLVITTSMMILFIYNSCFYKKLSQFNPHAIRRWTKNTDIFNKYLFIPICKDSHWLVVIVNNDKTTSIMIIDSLNGTHGSLERTVKRYLQGEWAAKEKQQPSGMNKNLVVGEVHYPAVPKQTNDKDCGLYVMKCFEEFLKDIEVTQFES